MFGILLQSGVCLRPPDKTCVNMGTGVHVTIGKCMYGHLSSSLRGIVSSNVLLHSLLSLSAAS